MSLDHVKSLTGHSRRGVDASYENDTATGSRILRHRGSGGLTQHSL